MSPPQDWRAGAPAPVAFAVPDVREELSDRVSRRVRKASLELGGLAGERDLFERLADALGLPDYFGHNWDALDECLRDLEARCDGDLVVQARGAAEAWQAHPEALGRLVAAFLDAATSWRDEGRTLSIVFDLAPSEIGAAAD